jgi:hypothetical protein
MLNKSYSYLVPLVNEFCPVDSDYILLLDNVFAKHSLYPEEKTLTIRYEFVANDPFMEYIDSFRKNELYLATYIDQEHVSVSMYFPREYYKEHNLYLKGKFSQFSEPAKEKILRYVLDIHKLKDAERVRRVLYRDPQLRKELEQRLDVILDPMMELSSIPDLKAETYHQL